MHPGSTPLRGILAISSLALALSAALTAAQAAETSQACREIGQRYVQQSGQSNSRTAET